MASAQNIQRRKSKFRFYPKEIEIYCEQMKTNNDSERVLEKMYEHLEPGDVPEELRKMYEKALFGSDEKFKEKVIQRIYRVGKAARQNPAVQEFEVFHAQDYGNMSHDALISTAESKKRADNIMIHQMRKEQQERRNRKADTNENIDEIDDRGKYSFSRQNKSSSDINNSESSKEARLSSNVLKSATISSNTEVIDLVSTDQENRFRKVQNLNKRNWSDAFEDDGDATSSQSTTHNPVNFSGYTYSRHSLTTARRNSEENSTRALSNSNKPVEASSGLRRKWNDFFIVLVMLCSRCLLEKSIMSEDPNGLMTDKEKENLGDIFSSFQPDFARKFITKMNFNNREDFVIQQFERVSSAAIGGLVEETAYYRGMGRKNNLNMEELRREVIQDLKLSEKPKNTRDSANSNATNPAHSSFQSDDRNVQDTSNQANGNSSERRIRLFADSDDDDDDYETTMNASNIDIQNRNLASSNVTITQPNTTLDATASATEYLQIDEDDDDETEAENALFRKLQDRVDRYIETEKETEMQQNPKSKYIVKSKYDFLGAYDSDIPEYQNQEGHPDVANLMSFSN